MIASIRFTAINDRQLNDRQHSFPSTVIIDRQHPFPSPVIIDRQQPFPSTVINDRQLSFINDRQYSNIRNMFCTS